MMTHSVFRFATLVWAAFFVKVEAVGVAGVRSIRHRSGGFLAASLQSTALPENQSSFHETAAVDTPTHSVFEQLRKSLRTFVFFRSVSFLWRDPVQDTLDENDSIDLWQTFVAQLFTIFGWVVLTIVVAYFYRQYNSTPIIDLDASKSRFSGEDFKHGLCTWYEEPEICAYSCCCTGIRWADTMAAADVLSFTTALIIFLILMTLDMITAAVTLWILLTLCFTYFRQTLRSNLGIISGGTTWAWDFAIWCFCVPCAVAQEARQVKEAPPHDVPPIKSVDEENVSASHQ
jgi:Cys-rich protein (TIGR01571 family)